MKYQAHINCDPTYKGGDRGLVAAASATLSAENAAPGEVTIVLTSEEKIRALNHRFANLDEPTDVLAFPAGNLDLATGKTYYGDVIIAMPLAQAQADRASHTLETELALLTVHGVLHLLGHDHTDRQDRKRMWSAQSRILSTLGLTFTPSEEMI